jgi:hypothetical protein
MAVAPPVVMAAALLEDDDGVALLLAQDLGGNRHAREERIANLDAFVAGEHQNLAELHNIAGLAGNLFNLDDVVGGHTILFAACLDDCEHDSSFFFPRPSAPPGIECIGGLGCACWIIAWGSALAGHVSGPGIPRHIYKAAK